MTAPDAIGRLTERFELPPPAAEQLDDLARLIATDHGAPTTLHEPGRIADDHLADSLVALELTDVPWSGARIADLGAGAGFPGLPLAIALPRASVALVESNTRKCDFLRAAIRRLGLDNVEVVRARAEQWRDGLEQTDIVVARALAALPVVAEYAAPLLTVGGSLVAWRGRRDAGEETAAGTAAVELGLDPGAPTPVHPYPAAEHRHLHVMRKLTPTPARFPRRPGVARKHPLGGPIRRPRPGV